MAIYVKDATGWHKFLNAWQKVDGGWKKCLFLHYKAFGQWKLVHVAQNPFIFTVVIASSVNNYNMRNAAIAAGWDTVAPLIATVTVNSGVIVGSSNVAIYAFSSGTTFPDGSHLTLNNYGSIVGRGGNGGNGGKGSLGAPVAPTAGTAGGPALHIAIPTSISNYGTIGGGGGGGGGGACARENMNGSPTYYFCSGGGGGGPRSCAASTAGSTQRDNSTGPYLAATGGGPSGPGNGGYHNHWSSGGYYLGGGIGGVGGGWGNAGASGGSGYTNKSGWTVTNFTSPSSGGAPGTAVNGNAYILWAVTGNRYGAIS